jgi:hypothetical protein
LGTTLARQDRDAGRVCPPARRPVLTDRGWRRCCDYAAGLGDSYVDSH